MLLSVLSGEKPVTEAIAEAKISRGTYYQMETRALHAMLAALNPIPAAAKSEEPDLRPRIQELNERIRRLEQDKRRTQRLLLLTRKSAWAPLTAPWRGRLPKSVWPGWTPSGSASSESSETSQETTNHSIPTKGGASEC